MKKIVTHKLPHHFDDWAAVALLLSLYPSAEIEYVASQSVPEEYLNDTEVILVDVGMDYNPALNNFDHHQDLNLPCSLTLVLKHFFPEIPESPAVRAIDAIDRFGLKNAAKQGFLTLKPENDELRKNLLYTTPTPKIGEVVKNTMKNMKVARDYNYFLEFLHAELDSASLLEEGKKRVEFEEKEFQRKLQKAQPFEYKDLRGLFSDEPLIQHYRVFKEGIDFVVESNVQNQNYTSIIKNTNSIKTQKINLLKEFSFLSGNVIFHHQSDFILVIDRKAEEVYKDILLQKVKRKTPKK